MTNKQYLAKKYWVYLTSSLIFLALFYKSLSYYFFQDDFYEILLSKVNSFEGFVNIFIFLHNRSSYRPIGLQTFFLLSQHFFGLNPFYYHVTVFVIFLGTCALIKSVATRLSQNANVGFLTSLLWMSSSIHFMSLSWLAAAWLIIGTFFFFLTTRVFFEYLNNKNIFLYLLSLILFVLTMGSFEFFISWPFIMFAYLLIFPRRKTSSFMILVPYLAITIFYAVARYFFASLPAIYEYKMEIGFINVKDFVWYILWSLNIPEEFKKQIIGHLIFFNKNFMSEFWPLMLKNFVSFAVICSLGVFLPIYKSTKKNNKDDVKIIIFSLVWFVTSIMPVIFFPNHTFAMYLALPSIGIYFLISYFSIKYLDKMLLIVLVITWLFSSYVTISFYRDSSWIVKSQEYTRQFASQIMTKYPSLPKSAVIYYPLDDKIKRQSFLDQNEVKVLYDPTVSIYFNEEELFKNHDKDKPFYKFP